MTVVCIVYMLTLQQAVCNPSSIEQDTPCTVIQCKYMYIVVQTTHPIICNALTRGSNLGPPGMARLSAFAVKNDLRSNR